MQEIGAANAASKPLRKSAPPQEMGVGSIFRSFIAKCCSDPFFRLAKS
jgi:hypothetical protein